MLTIATKRGLAYLFDNESEFKRMMAEDAKNYPAVLKCEVISGDNFTFVEVENLENIPDKLWSAKVIFKEEDPFIGDEVRYLFDSYGIFGESEIND
jgi:hypothetical protein